LGSGNYITIDEPVQLTFDIKIEAIASGGRFSLAVDENGGLWSWGNNEYGKLGDGTETNKLSPVLITTQTNIKTVIAGIDHSLAIDEEGNLWSWGNNFDGKVGAGKYHHVVNNPTLVNFKNDSK